MGSRAPLVIAMFIIIFVAVFFLFPTDSKDVAIQNDEDDNDEDDIVDEMDEPDEQDEPQDDGPDEPQENGPDESDSNWPSSLPPAKPVDLQPTLDHDLSLLDLFAQCLTTRGFTMYSKTGCPKCSAQRKLFGSSFQYIREINCDENPEACKDLKILVTPTWLLDGSYLYDVQSFDELSEVTGCVLP